MIDWYVEPNHSDAETGLRAPSRSKSSEGRANSLALIITSSLLCVLVASAVMVGGHAAIRPLLSRGNSGGDANNTGDIVYTMPDKVFCRHLSFDNATGALTEGPMERCADSSQRMDLSTSGSFKWNTH